MAKPTKQPRPPTWLEYAVANGGFRKANRAFGWAHSWIYVRVAFGRDPSVEEVAEWWNESPRTMYRDQAAFRECFPALDTPAPIYKNPEELAGIERNVKRLQKIQAAARRVKGSSDAQILSEGLLNPQS